VQRFDLACEMLYVAVEENAEHVLEPCYDSVGAQDRELAFEAGDVAA